MAWCCCCPTTTGTGASSVSVSWRRRGPGQVVVGLSQSGLMHETALAQSLRSGRLRAAWFDSLEPGWLESGGPLHGITNLQVTPRLAGTTRESRVRAAWAVARGIDLLLSPPAAGAKTPAKAADFY